MAERLERRFHSVIAENLADTECVLRQHCDDLLQRDNFDVLLDARVLPARKMTSIGRAWFAEGLARKKINLDHARMELRDLREIHAERPHRFQRRVDDDFLLGSERWLQILPPMLKPNQARLTPYASSTSRSVTMPSNLCTSARLTTGRISIRFAPMRSSAKSSPWSGWTCGKASASTNSPSFLSAPSANSCTSLERLITPTTPRRSATS